MHVIVLIPVFNDWTSAVRVLGEVDGELRAAGQSGEAILVDDGSVEQFEPGELGSRLRAIRSISILRLRRNLGHQRAIAVGLCHVESAVRGDVIVVMDGDGEDLPADVPRLLAALDSNRPAIVFAERTRRSEGWLFFFSYHLYRALHRLLTGERVRVGNFSAIPAPLLSRLVAVSDLWNHYAAAVFKSRLPYTTIPSARGRRYAGVSTMNYVGLVTHGLSAMAAFGDRIGVRLLAATLLASATILSAVVVLLAVQVVAGIAMPSWAPFVLGLAALLLFQALAVCLAFVFIILAGRDSSTFLPLRDYRYYILGVEQAHPALHEPISVRR